MRWYKELYVGETATKRKNKIIKNIEAGKKQIGVYVLAFPTNKSNIMDIYPAFVLTQKHYMNMDLQIVGIAASREEAIDLTQEILMECYKKTGQFRIDQFINEIDFK